MYVWSLETSDLVKVLDAHFARIIQLEALTIGNWNSVVTSSIDRSVKVWNINNIFEQVHVIDRHELQIDMLRYVILYKKKLKKKKYNLHDSLCTIIIKQLSRGG